MARGAYDGDSKGCKLFVIISAPVKEVGRATEPYRDYWSDSVSVPNSQEQNKKREERGSVCITPQ